MGTVTLFDFTYHSVLLAARYTRRMARRRQMMMYGVFMWAMLTVLAHAQAIDGGDVSLTVSPKYPRPGDSVHITVDSVTDGAGSGTVTWVVNGKKSANTSRAIDVTAGPLGSETAVDAVVDGVGRASTVIRPTELDLLWESDSYVPQAFRGRALPSAGSMLHLEAIPRFKRPDGHLVPLQDIIFTWRKGVSVLQSVSGVGKSSAIIPSPVLFGSDTISVEAHTTDGTLATESSVRIASKEPYIVLYQDDPLLGVTYYRAIGAQEDAHDVEMSLVAVPYYLASDPRDASLQYDWTLNGAQVPFNRSQPNRLTIGAEGAKTHEAQVRVSLTSSANMFLNSSGAGTILFSNVAR